MHLAMVAHIVFPAREDRSEISIRKIAGVRIESGWEMLTDRATITLPRNVRYFDKHKVKDVFKRGDKVEIYLGYDQSYIKEFEGFITKVSADTPIEIECEDAMYLLKRAPAHISLKESTAKGLIDAVLPARFNTDILDVEIGTVRFANTTVSRMLEELKKDYSLLSYIKDYNTLVCGKIYQDDQDRPVLKFGFERNIAGHSLIYKNREDVQVLVKGVSTLKDGSKIEAETGDVGGVEKQLSYYGITSKAAVQTLVEEDYKKFKVDGLEGDFEAFGIPSVRHGDRVLLESIQYPERDGTYWVKKVIKEFDDSPKYRQYITLDQKIA